MPYIIDGNNLIGSCPEIALDDPQARDKLIAILQSFQESKKTKITLVFDGDPQRGNHRVPITPKLAVLYPTYGNTADEEIKHQLEKYTNLREVVLVTSDRELKNYARDKGARTINSIEFYYEMKKVARHSVKQEETLKRVNTKLSQNEVEQWMKIFDRG